MKPTLANLKEMRDFPDGPFFNFRCRDEFPKWKRFIWKICGSKRVGDNGEYRATAYYFMKITYIDKVEFSSEPLA